MIKQKRLAEIHKSLPIYHVADLVLFGVCMPVLYLTFIYIVPAFEVVISILKRVYYREMHEYRITQ